MVRRALLLVLLIVLVLSSCGQATSSDTTTLRIGTVGAPDSLNPGTGFSNRSTEIWDLIYDSLLVLDAQGRAQPWLAERYASSADGLSWTFTLRESLRWSDGTPLTADDVAFTFNMMMGLSLFGYQREHTTLFKSVEASDPRTVTITLLSPVANMEQRAAALYVLPKHIWGQLQGEQAILEFANDKPVGSGPFVLEAYRPDQPIWLRTNPEHFSQPSIGAVVFQSYETQAALAQALQAGEIDLASELPPASVAELRANKDLTVVTSESRGLRDIIFNIVTPENCPRESGGVCSGHPALLDLQVRRALAHATDKRRLIDQVQYGLATPGLTLVPAAMGEAFNGTLTDYAYDPDTARKLLDQGGYTDSNGDGVRELPGKPDRPLKFRLLAPQEIPNIAEDARLLAAMWFEVGVQLDLEITEGATVTERCCPTFDYDILLWNWDSTPDPAFLLTYALSSELPTGTNESGYANPEFDRLHSEQAAETDPARRIVLLHQLQELLLNDVPYIIPYYPWTVQAYRNGRFDGWPPVPAGGVANLHGRLSLTTIRPVGATQN